MNGRGSSPIESGGELRWNEITQRWVVIAPSRGRRPVETDAHERVRGAEGDDGGGPRSSSESAGGGEAADGAADRSSAELPDRIGAPEEAQLDPSCPFCPGNEAEVPPIVWELQGSEAAGWSVRAIPNRFPAFSTPSEEVPHLPARPAEGYQEVLVESPRHLDDLCEMDETGLQRVVEAYRARYAALCEQPGVERVALFRNRGPRAGTSLRHPHAQLVAMALDPPDLRAREAAFRKLREEARGACPMCEPDAFEPHFDRRLIHRDEHLHAWVPWAAESPFEVWIAPRRHSPDFRATSDPELNALTRLLGRITRRYRDAAGDPDYNLLVHSAGPADPDPDPLHWWIRLRPRVGTEAGLELLSGVWVNPSSPDRDAGILAEEPGNTGAAHE